MESKTVKKTVSPKKEAVKEVEWLKYKRYSNHLVVEARLTVVDGTTYMEVKNPVMGDFVCPECKCILGKNLGQETMHKTFMEVRDFHAKHRPVSYD